MAEVLVYLHVQVLPNQLLSCWVDPCIAWKKHWHSNCSQPVDGGEGTPHPLLLTGAKKSHLGCLISFLTLQCVQPRAGATMSVVTSSCHNYCRTFVLGAIAITSVTSSCCNECSHVQLPQWVQSWVAATMSTVMSSCYNEYCHCNVLWSVWYKLCYYRQDRTYNTNRAEPTENSLMVNPIKGCVKRNLMILASCPLSNAVFSVPAS